MHSYFGKRARPQSIACMCEDKFENSTGKFTVAASYHKLSAERLRKMDIASSSNNPSRLKLARRRTWGFKIKRKIRHFIWKGLNNILSVLVNLYARGSNLEQRCQFYGEMEETQETCFFS
ncbi:ribonuclease H-like superfamily protein [Striga asiatica]|uniref:Ribonuclease H-like superfamily protein n=1 Tax=Striga asiatica TaxID=4170 RepID=A0A5A7P4L4_STRAF|nr:ribonuclease H-like superfamily protein [Striga asiatica]